MYRTPIRYDAEQRVLTISADTSRIRYTVSILELVVSEREKKVDLRVMKRRMNEEVIEIERNKYNRWIERD